MAYSILNEFNSIYNLKNNFVQSIDSPLIESYSNDKNNDLNTKLNTSIIHHEIQPQKKSKNYDYENSSTKITKGNSNIDGRNEFKSKENFNKCYESKDDKNIKKNQFRKIFKNDNEDYVYTSDIFRSQVNSPVTTQDELSNKRNYSSSITSPQLINSGQDNNNKFNSSLNTGCMQNYLKDTASKKYRDTEIETRTKLISSRSCLDINNQNKEKHICKSKSPRLTPRFDGSNKDHISRDGNMTPRHTTKSFTRSPNVIRSKNKLNKQSSEININFNHQNKNCQYPHSRRFENKNMKADSVNININQSYYSKNVVKFRNPNQSRFYEDTKDFSINQNKSTIQTSQSPVIKNSKNNIKNISTSELTLIKPENISALNSAPNNNIVKIKITNSNSPRQKNLNPRKINQIDEIKSGLHNKYQHIKNKSKSPHHSGLNSKKSSQSQRLRSSSPSAQSHLASEKSYNGNELIVHSLNMPIDKLVDGKRKSEKRVDDCDLLFKVNIRIDEYRSAKVEFCNSDSVEVISDRFCKYHQLDNKRKFKIEKLLMNLKKQYVNDF